MNFKKVIAKYREDAISKKELGDHFEKLMVGFLKTYQVYESTFKHVWQWKDFPYRESISLNDVGVDLVAETDESEFWAIQCKCWSEDSYISKADIDSFIATSSKKFTGPNGKKIQFERRLLISTSNNWSKEAENSIENQAPPFLRIPLSLLEDAQVDWEKIDQGIYGANARVPQKTPKDHQIAAMKAFHEHFKTHDRGKLILPCGTGKTYTSLKIVENETKGKGLILFLAPSIALVGQTLREWTTDATYSIYPICVCSDAEISKKFIHNEDDTSQFDVENLAYPASTNPKEIIFRLNLIEKNHPNKLCVIFSTYQSIERVAEAISKSKRTIDLIICDEAHRTTGVTLAGENESHFVKVHDQKFLPAKKRLYMTATPKIYGDNAKKTAETHSVKLCSMDDPGLYGEEV